MANWETYTIEETLTHFGTHPSEGLSQDDVNRLRAGYGTNKLEKERGLGLPGKIARQFKNPLVFVLLGAGILTLFLREFVDSLVIAIALLINVAIGAFQEERASKAFEKLNSSQEPFATVIREGKKKVIPAADVVVGDLVVLEGGSAIPADLRIITAKDLSINEAALTGEWVAVDKHTDPIKGSAPLAEKHNMAWMGTLAVSGYGSGVVTAVGPKTEIGKIAHTLGTIDEQMTPLQENIQRVARFLMYIIGLALVAIFVIGILRGESLSDMLLVAIAIAVATMPSGLPAAVTVVLALGMEAILSRGGLVRNLLAAETLGATTIILTDKTGTLTEAKMELSALYTLDSLKHPTAEIFPLPGEAPKTEHPGRDQWGEDDHFLLQSAVFNADAFTERVQEKNEDGEGKIVVHGRAIEKAVVLAGLEAGISLEDLERNRGMRRVDFTAFESDRRYAASVVTDEKGGRRLFVTGAPELLLSKSESVYRRGKQQKLTKDIRALFERMQTRRSTEGMRLIAAAYKEVLYEEMPRGEKRKQNDLLEDLTFIGLLIFSDPVRPDVAESIEKVKRAGAQVIMITGDNPETAGKIARDVGIATMRDPVRTGAEIENADDDVLYRMVTETKVFARTLPSQKLRIARVLKNRGEVVAMTGDGINDAPALRSASIGVAVGSGTEVAKEASDIILLNNSFSIIVVAIEEGRKIIENLKKIIAYLLSTSFSEIFVIGGALAVGVPLPFLPSQILWANIIEEGLMSFAFAFEKGDPKLMKRSPRAHSAKRILTPALKKLIFIVSIVTGVLLIALYFFLLSLKLPIEEIRTIMFAALSLDAIFFSFSLKSLDTPLWKINPFTNRFLLIALVSSIALLIGALSWGPLQSLLTLVPLTTVEILLLVGVGIANLITIELSKYFIFEKRPISV